MRQPYCNPCDPHVEDLYHEAYEAEHSELLAEIDEAVTCWREAHQRTSKLDQEIQAAKKALATLRERRASSLEAARQALSSLSADAEQALEEAGVVDFYGTLYAVKRSGDELHLRTCDPLVFG